jgi:hypothetical protein
MANFGTFAQTVARCEARNAAALTERAITANSLAKILTGDSRRCAYDLKAEATARLLSIKWASVVPDKHPASSVVLIRLHTNGRGLHLRRQDLAA